MKSIYKEPKKERARRLLKGEMAHRGITNVQLAKLLRNQGLNESQASINNKLSRGSFSAAFLLDALAALGATEMRLDSNTHDQQAIRVREDGIQTALMLGSSNFKTSKIEGLHENIATGARWIDVSTNKGLPRIFPNKVISLFTGAGGLDIGLEMAGFETVACIEIDIDCRTTLAHNRPHWGILADRTEGREPGDIKSIRAAEILEFTKLNAGEAALVVGGAPCQAFSNIGKRQGVADIENGGDLFAHFVRIVKGVLPYAFIFENVAGITQSKHSDVIAYMREQFRGLGYGLTGCILNSANYGVPQKRERFIFIGLRGVAIPALPLPFHYKDKKSWANFIKDIVPFVDQKPLPWTTVGDAFSAIPKSLINRADYALMNISDFVQERMKLIGPGENFHVLPMKMRPKCWQTGRHQGQDTFGRLHPDQASVTIRTAAYNPAKGRYIHPFENRGLSSHEMAALQTFPTSWELKSSRYDRVPLVSAGRQIGNAVPPLLARAIGHAIRKQLPLCSEY